MSRPITFTRDPITRSMSGRQRERHEIVKGLERRGESASQKPT
jgi:hypothetical protein